jgi:uncharacterized membrane-anchored protein YjiN (DUF445 family)
MGSQIIKQPNGLYCKYSSISDSIEFWNYTVQDIVDDLIEYYKEVATREVNNVIQKLDNGGKPYYQFTLTFDEALKEAAKRMNPLIINEIINSTDLLYENPYPLSAMEINHYIKSLEKTIDFKEIISEIKSSLMSRGIIRNDKEDIDGENE